MADLLLIVAITLLTMQILLALTSMWQRSRLHRNFLQPLGSMTSLAQLLEKYSRVVEPFNIKVNARINTSVASRPQILLVNRNHVYRNDLYANCMAVWHIKLTKPENKVFHQYQTWQTLLFILEVILLVMGIYISYLFFYPTIALTVGLLIYGYIVQMDYSEVQYEFLEHATDMLDLDPVEQARAKVLSDKLKMEVFMYPVRPIQWVIGFINPF